MPAKGRTTLPKDVRRAQQLSAGDRVRYMILDGGEVRLVRSRPVGRLAGLLKERTDKVATLDEMEAATAKGVRAG